MTGKEMERIAVLETKVDDILDNHLPSIERKIDCLFSKMNKIQWSIIGLLCVLLTNLVLSYLK